MRGSPPVAGPPQAGDVYLIELQGRGHEQRGPRPVIVVQDDDALPLSTRLCVPTSASAAESRWRIPVRIGEQDSLALVEQLRAISNDRLRRRIARISHDELAQIRAAAARLIGIRPS
jgi:mRNA-degrading endonuclease toxin of MazEF toxin-antitoxin module